MGASRRVIFDTDIGSDVDDALALGVLMGSPDLDLVAVTTVYGNTALRARLARRYGSLAGRSLTVYAGAEQTLSGREVWWPGHEGTLHPDLESENFEPEHAVDFLVRTVLDAPGTVDIVAVGPLTNIAAAIQRDELFAGAVRHLWIMGGNFEGTGSEHNFRSDIAAARIVFASKIPMTVSGLEVTQLIEMGVEQLDAIAASGNFGRALERDIHQWWEFWNMQWNVPHDPVAVLSMVSPELFTFSELGVVSVSEENNGASAFEPSPQGTVRLVTTLDPSRVSNEIVSTIQRAQAI